MGHPVIFLCTDQLEAVTESAVHRGGFRTINQGVNRFPSPFRPLVELAPSCEMPVDTF